MIYTFNDGYCPHKVQPKKCHVQNILRKVYGWDFWRSSTELTSLITPQFQVEPNPKRLMAGSQKITQLKRKIIWTQTHHFPASSCFHPPGDKKTFTSPTFQPKSLRWYQGGILQTARPGQTDRHTDSLSTKLLTTCQMPGWAAKSTSFKLTYCAWWTISV